MSAKTETGLARFDTHACRAARTDERSEQIDFRTIGAREQGQLALDEIEDRVASTEDRASFDTLMTTGEPTRADLEVALGCARATIDGLREQVAQLEAERDRFRNETETEGGR